MGDHFKRKGTAFIFHDVTEWIDMRAGLCQASLAGCCISWWKSVNKSPKLRFQSNTGTKFSCLICKKQTKSKKHLINKNYTLFNWGSSWHDKNMNLK